MQPSIVTRIEAIVTYILMRCCYIANLFEPCQAGRAAEFVDSGLSIDYDVFKGKKLGEGQFGAVYAGVERLSMRLVAIKCVKTEQPSIKDALNREVELLQEVRNCRNIVSFEGVYEGELYTSLVFEQCANDLFSEIVDSAGQYLPERRVRQVAKAMVDAVAFCHHRGIAHRDLKPENVLVRKDGSVCLADFGLSSRFTYTTRMYSKVGSAFYIAPEVMCNNDQGYDESCDVWSIGAVTYCMLCGNPPYYAETDMEVIQKLLYEDYDFDLPEFGNVSTVAKDFIRCLMNKSVLCRLTAEQVQRHEFLTGSKLAANYNL